MPRAKLHERKWSERVSKETRVSWSRYAEAYDLLCSVNPHYAMNVEVFKNWIASIPFVEGDSVCEIGAGTGNFLLAAAELRPDLRYVHWDFNPEMNRAATMKYKSAKIDVEVVESDLKQFPFVDQLYDAIVAVNCLYATTDPRDLVHRIFGALEPGGYFFCIDLGRPLDVAGWVKELLYYNYKDKGLFETLKLVVALRQAIVQNRSIDKSQGGGAFKEHSPEEFRRTFQEAGFVVIRQELCYRDKCDLLVAQRPRSIQVDLGIDELVSEPNQEICDPVRYPSGLSSKPGS